MFLTCKYLATSEWTHTDIHIYLAPSGFFMCLWGRTNNWRSSVVAYLLQECRCRSRCRRQVNTTTNTCKMLAGLLNLNRYMVFNIVLKGRGWSEGRILWRNMSMLLKLWWFNGFRNRFYSTLEWVLICYWTTKNNILIT